MSLQVWLPLNGELRNQGVGKITSISTTPKYRENGKLFQLAIDLSKRVTFTCPNLKNLQDFSIAFWAYVDNVESLAGKEWVDLFGFTDTSSSGSNGTFRFETCYNTSHGIAYYDNTTMALINHNGRTYTTSKNIWIHCCVVFDNINHKVYAYKNGTKFGTDTHKGGKFNANGTFYIGETDNIAGMLQDLRIYNHALSAKEVAEIAKGLVLHYPLNDIRVNKIESTTYSGAIVNFNARDEQLPIDDITINIEPVQSGSGDPSPENIRPITGWTECNVKQSQKNLVTYLGPLKSKLMGYPGSGSHNMQIIYTKIKAEHTYTISFNVSEGSTTHLSLVTFAVQKPDGTWTSGSRSFTRDDNTQTDLNSIPTRVHRTFTSSVDSSIIKIGYYSTSEYLMLYPETIQIVEGDQLQNLELYNYIPKKTISFPTETGTVYGGTLTINDDGVCELIVDKEFISLDGNVEWIELNSDSSGSGKFFASVIPVNSAKQNTDYISNQYLFAGDGATQSKNVTIDKRFYGQRAYGRIWVYDSDYLNNLDGFKAALNTTPLQITYPLDSPMSYTLTTEQITTLLGTNNIWADCGNVSITYSDNGSKIIYDCSGYRNNGTVIGDLSIVSPSPKYNYAAYFNDYTTKIQAPLILSPQKTITLAVWIKSSNKTPRGDYHTLLNINGNYYELSIYKDGKFRQGFNINDSRVVDTVNSKDLLDGQWHHLCATFNGEVIKRYVDGISVTNGDHLVSGLLKETTMLHIGQYGEDTNTYGNTQLYESDIRIYTTALTDVQVKELYLQSKIVDGNNLIARDLE